MNSFEIEYGKQKLTVEVIKRSSKDDVYEYKVNFPEITNDKGITFREFIVGRPVMEEDRYVGMEWRHTASLKDFPQYYVHTWLMSNGHMAHSNFKDPKPVELPEKFNPDSDEKGNVFVICKKIFAIAKQIIEAERIGKIPDEELGMTPYEILELRRDVLNTALTLLGKSDEGTPSFFVLGKIGKRLEEYQNLGVYVRRTMDSKGRESFELKLPEDFKKEEFAQKVGKVRATLAEDKAFIEAQEEQLANQRMFLADFGEDGYTDYCVDITKSPTVLPEEATLYNNVVSNIADFYRSLNADLIPYSQSRKVSNAVSLDGKKLADKISGIIDTREFEKACDIEDRFVIGEAERFSAFIDKTIEETPRTQASSMGGTLLALKRAALSTRERKQEYMEKHGEMLASFSSSTKTYTSLDEGVTPHE